MKRLVIVFLLLASAHGKYIPDPIVRYNIDAQLDPASKMLRGSYVLLWKNTSSDSIPDLQFHLYLNAFKNNLSTFAREGGNTRGKTRKLGENPYGYQEVKLLKVDGADLTAAAKYISPDDGNPHDQTVLQVMLPKPIAPGQTVKIELAWDSRLPRVQARTGWHDNFFLVAQWFPKIGVYEAQGVRHREQGGWNCHQFHSFTEFYADYGHYDVKLTVPTEYELASSGTQRSHKDNGNGTTTYNYYQEDVHDFAWTTQPKSQVEKVVRTFKADEQTTAKEISEWSRKTGALPEDVKLQDVQVTLFIQREHRDQIDRHFKATFAGIKYFGLMYGKYPYDVLTVVDPPFGGYEAGGMEYPTFITAGTDYWPGKYKQDPEHVIVHEFGHQFWYALVGNNEFEEAWLDEGFNSYSTGKVLEMAYGPFQSYHEIFNLPVPGAKWLELPVPRYPWYGVREVPLGQYWEWVPKLERYGNSNRYWKDAKTDSLARLSYLNMTRESYGDQAYSKPELTLRTLDNLLGDAWPRVIRTYYQRWRFKHPDARDFIDTVNEVSGRDMNWFFDQTVFGTGTLDYSVSFTNDREPKPAGYVDENGAPKFVGNKLQDGDKRESEVLVRRLGEMQFPVTVRVKFEDGSGRTEQWDGKYAWQKFKYDKRIVLAEVDPAIKWNMEVMRTDNAVQADAVRLAPDKWYLRWVVWIQNLLSVFSYFS
jgi:hypothetical protein